VEVTGAGAGAHVVLWPAAKRISETAVAEQAALRGVGVYGISRYYLARSGENGSRPSRSALMLGYSSIREQQIREGIRRLSEIL
jgi:GntR family transcriptional regulator/MocR family aminotransferase